MSRHFLWTVAGLALLTAGLALFVRNSTRSFEKSVAEAPKTPPGRWHSTRSAAPTSGTPDELARTVSLPYLAGTRLARSESGVVALNPERAFPGLNLYVSGHAPEAILFDLEGRVLHRWRYSYPQAFPTRDPIAGTQYWRRAHLFPNGDLLALFQGGGMIKLDRDSQLLWSIDLGFYNDLEVAPDGTIFAIGKQARVLPELHEANSVLEDEIVVIDSAGRVQERISLFFSLWNSDYRALIHPVEIEGDIFHTNTIEYFDGRIAHLSKIFRKGNLLVSMREIDLVAILDPRRKTLVWAKRGSWDAQHQPTLLANGHLLLFDNLGAGGASRVLEFNSLTDEIVWDYRGPEGRPLSSPEVGSVQRLANGNTLITESEQGRAFEITAAGDIVWEFASPHRSGPNLRFVATLFELVRLDPEYGEFAAGWNR